MFLTMPFSKSNIYLWNMVVLAYGSLVFKYCASYTPCPVAAVQVIKLREKAIVFKHMLYVTEPKIYFVYNGTHLHLY